MKKLLLTLALFLMLPVFGEILRGSVVFEVIPKGFFGTWHVTSKMENSNNPKMFNSLSVDVWNLSGSGNVLILENAMSGAKSSIKIQPQNGSYDGKTLKFERVKEEKNGKHRVIERESPEFVLDGNIFRGYDTFIIEKYKDDKLISKDIVKYKVLGQKISGESKIK